MSKYSVNGLPWASGIGKDVSDCTTAQEVMQKAGLDFYVNKCDLVARMPFSINGNNKFNKLGGEFAKDGYIYRDCPKAYGTYRTDTNTPLGLVKDKYEVIQNIEAFNFFNDAIGLNKAKWDRAGKFGYGHKIFVSAKLPNIITVGKDEIDNYLVFSNSHDGSSSINILFSPIRVICTNMLNSALNSSHSYIRIKHTKSARDKIERGSEILKIACEHANNAKQLYDSLLTIKMSDEEVMKYIANLQLTEAERLALLDYDDKNGYKKLFNSEYLLMERTNISQRKINQITNMFEYYMDGIGQKDIAGTAWGAYNAVTGFYSNVANLEKEKRVDSLLYGGANRNMNKALVSAVNLKIA